MKNLKLLACMFVVAIFCAQSYCQTPISGLTATSNGSYSGCDCGPEKTLDGNPSTYWFPAGTSSDWIQINLPQSYVLNKIVIKLFASVDLGEKVQLLKDGAVLQELTITYSGSLLITLTPTITQDVNCVRVIGNFGGGDDLISEIEIYKVSNTTNFEKIIVTDKVGIGTNDPQESLHINGNIRGNVNGALRISTGYGTLDIGPQNIYYAHIYTDRPNVIFNTPVWSYQGAFSSYGTNNLSLQTNGTTRLMIQNSTGNVGIGITTPAYLLDVAGAIRTSNMFINDGYNSAQIRLNSSGNYFGKIGNPQEQVWSLGYGGSGIDINPILNWTATGNVGIGTTTPAYLLDVAGAIRTSNMFINDGYNSAQIRLNSSGNYFGKIGNPQEQVWSLGYGGSGIDINPILNWTATGKVGIGTTNPQNALDVNGTVRAKEVKVTTSGWSDFVFNAGYKLPSLSEVELYVKANKHLPEIPSAKEVEQNGVSLGEMQNKLLQKLEELTLYAIKQNRENESLKKENEELKARLEAIEKAINDLRTTK